MGSALEKESFMVLIKAFNPCMSQPSPDLDLITMKHLNYSYDLVHRSAQILLRMNELHQPLPSSSHPIISGEIRTRD